MLRIKHKFKLELKRYLTKLPDNYNRQHWKSVVGLEVHAQINTNSKLFSGSCTKFMSPVNTNVSLFDCSIPGTLPVLNKKCVKLGILTALAMDCKVNPVSMFDRKHYFYADMPAGYQITQQRQPLAINGSIKFQVITQKKNYKKLVRIKQLQLEQDSAKSLHDHNRSLVDLNRTGVPLMEFVFEPDLNDGEEAASVIKELIAILQRIDSCNCKMEEGALRVDANVSIHRDGDILGCRTEIKNIGSIRGVAGAVKYEIERQIKIKEAGGEVINETRAWDAENRITVPMRDKEQLQDYRYMPEPNLPLLYISIDNNTYGDKDINIDELKKTLPELPEETRSRLQGSLGLSLEQSVVLVDNIPLLKLFEDSLKGASLDPKLLANVLINEFNTLINKKRLTMSDINCDATQFREIVELLQTKIINRNTVMMVLNEILSGNRKPVVEIVKENNWTQITDEHELSFLCKQVLRDNEEIVNQYKNGKTKVFKALLGIVASKSCQRADMTKCNIILKQLLDKTDNT